MRIQRVQVVQSFGLEANRVEFTNQGSRLRERVYWGWRCRSVEMLSKQEALGSVPRECEHGRGKWACIRFLGLL